MCNLFEQLNLAQLDDKDALENMIREYLPLIIKHCKTDGIAFDKDCMQYLIISFVMSVKSFKISKL